MSVKRDGLYKRGSIWWLRTDPVTGKPRSTECRDLEAARLYRAKRERLKADPAHAAAETARLDEWIRRVIAVKESDGSSWATVEVYRTKLGHWLRLYPDAMLSEVGPDMGDRYWLQRKAEDVTDHTISKEFTHLTTVLKAAKRAGCYPGDIATLRPPGLSAGYKPRKRALSREEVVALMAELKPELAALVAICVSLGCRLSEAYRLQPADIGPTSVHIRGTKTDEADRVVPALSIFRGLLAIGVAALPLGSEPNNLRRDISAACARAGIANATPNDLRRTHATLLAEAGVDRDVTRRLLGHTTTRLVDTVYGQPTTEALGALAEAKLLTAAPVEKHGTERENQDVSAGALPEVSCRGQGKDLCDSARGGRSGENRVHQSRGEPPNGPTNREPDTITSLHDDSRNREARASDSPHSDRAEDPRRMVQVVTGNADDHAMDGAGAGLSKARELSAATNSLHSIGKLTESGADSGIRNPDLRFTKPVSGPSKHRDKPNSSAPSGLSRGEQTRLGLLDDTKSLQRLLGYAASRVLGAA